VASFAVDRLARLAGDVQAARLLGLTADNVAAYRQGLGAALQMIVPGTAFRTRTWLRVWCPRAVQAVQPTAAGS
jgi:hypothetical protein